MTQKDKELLLKDLCARLPYGVKIHLETPKYGKLIGTLDALYPTEERVIVDNLDKAIAPINVRCGGFLIERDDVKPYLRPMSSMTEEEKEEFHKIKQFSVTVIMSNGVSIFKPTYTVDLEDDGDGLNYLYDWLNSHYFDYRGLIEKGLALEASEGMYNIK